MAATCLTFGAARPIRLQAVDLLLLLETAAENVAEKGSPLLIRDAGELYDAGTLPSDIA